MNINVRQEIVGITLDDEGSEPAGPLIDAHLRDYQGTLLSHVVHLHLDNAHV